MKCVCNGSMFVSCWMLMSSVQPVAMCSDVFCIVCSFVIYIAVCCSSCDVICMGYELCVLGSRYVCGVYAEECRLF